MVASQRIAYLKHDVQIYRKSLAVQIRAAAALRGAFLLQAIGMLLNDVALIAAWLFFFDFFGTIRGWSAGELVGLQGVNMFIFGLIMLMSQGIIDLTRHVDQGSFDSYLLRPSSIIGQLAGSRVDLTSLGDVAAGLIFTGWYIIQTPISPVHTLLFILALLAACVIFWCFVVLLPSLLAFYIYDSRVLGRNFASVLLDSGIYPTGILTGPLRTILLTIVPGLLVAAVPLDALRGVNWPTVGIAVAVAAFWLMFSGWFFRRSVRRYESANLIGAR